MKKLFFPIVIGVVSVAAGCVTTNAHWDQAGFHQDHYGWEVPYLAGQKRLVGADWKLDNYHYDTAAGRLMPKEGNDYVAYVREDEDGDGRIEYNEKQRIFLYDLRFVHARNNGVIWVQTFRVPLSDADRDLDVVLANYADSLAGTGLNWQGTIFNLSVPRTRSFTVFVNDKKETKVGLYPAQEALIELAETSRLQLNKEERSLKLRVVLSKFSYLEESRPEMMNSANARSVNVNGNTFKQRTAVILIGYVNDPDHFESGVGDFEDFRGRLRWHPRAAAGRPAALPKTETPIR